MTKIMSLSFILLLFVCHLPFKLRQNSILLLYFKAFLTDLLTTPVSNGAKPRAIAQRHKLS